MITVVKLFCRLLRHKRNGLCFLLLIFESILFASARPRIVVLGGNLIDFGKVAPSRVRRSVGIVNSGDGVLIIKSIHAGCSCTSAPISRTELMEGDTAWMDVSMDVSHRHGTVGSVIDVENNDSLNGMLSIKLLVQVAQEVTVYPKTIPVIGNAVAGIEYSVSVQITNTSDSILEVFPPQIDSSKHLRMRTNITENKQLMGHDSCAVNISFTPLHSGYLLAAITLRTSSEITPEIPLQLTCMVAGGALSRH